jgi:lipopolysaccharide export system protein LptC
MTDSASRQASERLTSVAGRDNQQAFRLANRHTRRVKWIRRGIVASVAGLSLGIVGYAFFDPLRAVLPANMSISGAGLSGSRVTMAKPKMSGFRSDGRPYDFTADTAVQDLRKPNELELNQLDAHVTMPDKSIAHIVADKGIYDASKDIMDLDGNIHLTGASGYDVRMSKAHVQFKAGNVSTPQPVTVLMQSGSVNADQMTMVDNGKQITFVGHVHSVMLPASQATAAATPDMKGTVQ